MTRFMANELTMKRLWNIVSEIGVNRRMSSQLYRSIVLTNRMTGIAFLTILLYIPVALLFVPTLFLVIILTMALAVLLTFYFNHIKRYNLSRHYLLMLLLAIVGFVSLVLGIKLGANYCLIPLSILPLILFNSRQMAFLYGGFIICIFLVIDLFPVSTPLYSISDNGNLKFLYQLNIATILTLYIVFNFQLRFSADKKISRLIKLNERSEEKNKKIEQSLKYASAIQFNFLPPTKKIREKLPESFVFYRPKDIVSGDFYWMEQVGNKLIVSAVDCTGHGVPGALVSFLGHQALNACVFDYRLDDAGLILDKMTSIIQSRLRKEDNEMLGGMDMSICVLDLSRNKLQFAGANNNLYFLRKKDHTFPEGVLQLEGWDYNFYEIKADRCPIGELIENHSFTTHEISLVQGDTFYIFSDGYADQFGGKDNRKFMSNSFKNLLLTIQDQDMEIQQSILKHVHEDWKGEEEQVDDICVIGIRIT